MILRPHPLPSLGGEELVALERRDHLVDVVAVRLLDRVHDQLRGDESVRREEIRHLVLLRQLFDEPRVDLVLRAVRHVVREQVDASQHRPEGRIGDPVGEARHELRRARDPLLLQGLPHLQRIRPGPAHSPEQRRAIQ